MIDITRCVVCGGTILLKDRTCKDYTVSNEIFTLLKCASCDVVITSPRPEDEALGKYYLSNAYISHAKEATTLVDKIYTLARNYTLGWKTNLIRKQVNNPKPSILDYGTGTGTFVGACLDKQWNALGVEPSNEARKAASEKVKSSIHQNLANITQREFDVITLWHVLEHIPNLRETLKDLVGKLKPGGYLFIAVPNKNSHDAKVFGDYWAGYDVPRHLWHFSQDNIKALATAEGLTLEKIVPMKLDSYYVSLLSANYKYPNQKLINLFRGFIQGLLSNIHATLDGEYSSLLYIIKK
jgi:SAM-dependent methyltransferase